MRFASTILNEWEGGGGYAPVGRLWVPSGVIVFDWGTPSGLQDVVLLDC